MGTKASCVTWRGLTWRCVVWLSLGVLACSLPGPACAQEVQGDNSPGNGALGSDVSGTIRGTVVDQTGAVVAGARVRLGREGEVGQQETLTDETGQFIFASVAAGNFKLVITAEGFAARNASGTVRAGESYTVPQISMILAGATAELRVTPSQVEVAEDQIKVEEKQRLMGVIPNFYVSYDHHAVPLTPKQKFELAWKTVIDPVNFGVNGAIAGFQQAQNDFSGYGQGAAGYGRRYGASYGDFVSGVYIGGAILPSLLKQDPRYFYKGTGSVRSRVMYAIVNAVICKGDNGRWEPNYSGIVGSLASGGISNLYYPAKNRDGAELTFENALINIGATAATNILQEFVFRRLTPSSKREAAKPQSIIDEPSPAPSGIAEDRTMSTIGYPAALARE